MKKYVYGNPIETDAVILDFDNEKGQPEYGKAIVENGKFIYTLKLEKDDVVYGLGQTVRGMNKRGWKYISNATDDPSHDEDKNSLYAAHNFLIVDSKKPFGIFVDQPSEVTFDIGYTKEDEMVITCDENLKFYIIEGSSPLEITKEFRKAIGTSYLAPKFAFGFGQSRWGYKDKADFRNVLKQYNENDMPIDMIYMDIDYMQDYKDFTLNESEFANDFQDFVNEMKEQKIHLVPIIDAAVKKEDGYDVYEEGKANNYFCKLEDRKTDFEGAAWPGYAMFPDFLNDEAREWFGNKYHILTDYGIDAFWNDMNEPAIFFSRQGIEGIKKYFREFADNPSDDFPIFEMSDQVNAIKNSPEDYRRFWHNYNGRWVRHDKVHNLYGYFMTRSASEAFDKLRPDERTLMYSRSSYIGMHRYGGIWTGDNKSWWSHIPLLIHQLPGLNMSGFLYTGADLGGFAGNATGDLVLRFMQLGLFTPLMRNHSALGTRDQEPYQFENKDDFAHILKTRYRLIPYLYSEYLKGVRDDEMMFKPLAFEFRDDPMAKEAEDQILLGNEIMLAPVYNQNATGRTVYLPEEMMKVSMKKDGSIETEIMPAGWGYFTYPLDEVVFFIRKGKAVPLGKAALRTADLDDSNLELIGYPDGEYLLYEDDGISRDAVITKRLIK